MEFTETLGLLLYSLSTNAVDNENVSQNQQNQCAIRTFMTNLQSAAKEAYPGVRSADVPMKDLLSSLSYTLEREEQSLESHLEQSRVAREKLKAEINRVEMTITGVELRLSEVKQSKALCRVGINGLINYENQISERSPIEGLPTGGLPSPGVVMERPKQSEVGGVTSADFVSTAKAVLSRLQTPGVRDEGCENSLAQLQAAATVVENAPWGLEDAEAACSYLEFIPNYLRTSRPPNLLLSLQVTKSILRRTMSQAPFEALSIDSVLDKGELISTLVKLLSSVNDNTRTEAVECLNCVLSEGHYQTLVGSCGGVLPLVDIAGTTSSEALLDVALTALWQLASTDEGLRGEIRDADGLRIVMELLFTDTMSILNKVCIAIVYLTRDQSVQLAARRIGGYEKLVAMLRHPSSQIQSKIAAALWNCACDDESKSTFRSLGAIPALLELLQSKDDSVLENVSGAIWNLVIDNENKLEVLHFGGVPLLINALESSNQKVVENCTGILWNCSAIPEHRPAIRKAGGFAPLFGILGNKAASLKARDNTAAAIRNLAIHDQNKVAIRNCGGIGVLVGILSESVENVKPEFVSVVEKTLVALWVLTVASENRHEIHTTEGAKSLLALIGSTQSALIFEKSVGVLRNYAAEKDYRRGLIDSGSVRQVLSALKRFEANVTPHAVEAVCGLFWSLGREDKSVLFQEGALSYVCKILLSSASFPEKVSEQAAGALSSLTMKVEVREVVREMGVLPVIISALTKRLWKKGDTIVNAILVLRNCTASAEGARCVDVVINSGGHITICDILKERIHLISVDPNRRAQHEDIAKEACLCLKNCVVVQPQIINEISKRGIRSELQTLIQVAESDAKKAASVALGAIEKLTI